MSFYPPYKVRFFIFRIIGFFLVPFAVGAQLVDLDRVDQFHEPNAVHCIQSEMLAIADPHERFLEAFECGDLLFDTQFNALDGGGANVGAGQRFTRTPRADLVGVGEWANHIPARATGPNGQACTTCHNLPFEDGAGQVGSNASRDPLHTGNPAMFINRNTPHLFSAGALQSLAEEITTELQQAAADGRQESCDNRNRRVRVKLSSKGSYYGRMFVRCDGEDSYQLRGIDEDLVVKPFQWKGKFASLRSFNVDASHNELGMQSVELVGDTDGDFDGVTAEFGIGDQTAISIYLAAQPRPVSLMEMDGLGLIDLGAERRTEIERGEVVFADAGCARCHSPSMTIDNPVFNEPSLHPAYRDDVFPAGQDAVSVGVDPANAISFNFTTDMPDNVVEVDGEEVGLGNFEADADGGAIVRLYGDLRRHDMGPGLAESIDETGTGASTWITKELWGVGSTAPYLHDGRATTLTEAILAHGGDASESRDAAGELSDTDHSAMIAFLNNLVLFKLEEED